MSKVCSPRPLCSMTIGTIPSAWGSRWLALFMSMSAVPQISGKAESPEAIPLLLLTHQLVEGDGLVGDLDLAEHPADDVVFDGDGFDVVQALRLGVVPAHDFFRLLVGLGHFFDQGTHLVAIGLQVFALDQLGQDQAE